jgi:glycerophosphoryl diester phosphodiesterase
VIALERRDGRPLRIGHRGAAALAPENTLASFRAALAHGVDLVEFDVFELRSGDLVVAHSNDLHEVSHGTHEGAVRDLSVAELKEVSPELPTFEEALAFFVDEAPALGLHLDLKVRGRERDVLAALRLLGLRERSILSTFHVRSVRALAALDPALPRALSIPREVGRITESGRGAPLARAGLAVLRRRLPLLVPRLLAFSQANALSLHHTLVTERAVRRAHDRGAPVIAWTVDDPADLARVDAAGVDAVVTNDPTMFASTLET